MKKLLPLFLVLALLLTGCGLAEQAQTVKKEYIDPAVEAAKTGGTATTDAGNAGPSVKADWTAFLAWTAPETVGSRAQAQLIDTFAPSASYGTLTPFSGGAQGALYGLSTASGQVVLDPVLAAHGITLPESTVAWSPRRITCVERKSSSSSRRWVRPRTS